MKAVIAIDDWKLSIFSRHLTQAGYAFTKAQGLTPDMLILSVETPNVNALGSVVLAANTEAAGVGVKH